jgi:uncharacterized membrane protein YbhN (UPF0104 family)
MKKEGHILRVVAFLIGIIIFVYTIYKFGGVRLIATNLAEMRYYYGLIALNSFVWMLFYTGAWQQMFRGLKEKISFSKLFRIKLCGEGVNFMTPLGFMAGDPIRLLLLKKHFGPEARLRSVVVDRTLHSLAAQYFNIIGLSLIFTQTIAFPLWMLISLLILYIFICAILTILIVRMTTGKGFGIFEKLFIWIKLEKRFPKAHDLLCELRTNLNYYRDRPKYPFFVAFTYHFIGRFLMAVEIMIACYCFTSQFDLVFSVILASLTSFFAVAFGFIPGALGILETMYAQFFTLYGYPPDMGITIQIVRRMRVLFWVGIGIMLLDYESIGDYTKKLRNSKILGRKTKKLTKS